MSCGCGTVQTGGSAYDLFGKLTAMPGKALATAKSKGQSIVNYNANKMSMMPTPSSIGSQVGRLTEGTGDFFSSAKHFIGMNGGNGSCGAAAYNQDGGRRGGYTRKGGKSRKGGKRGGFHHGTAHTRKGGRKSGGRKAGGRKTGGRK